MKFVSRLKAVKYLLGMAKNRHRRQSVTGRFVPSVETQKMRVRVIDAPS